MLIASLLFSSLQEQTKLDTSKQVISPEECDDLSPMPQSQVPPVRRRGGISAEPVSEEDATNYVKKVIESFLFYFYNKKKNWKISRARNGLRCRANPTRHIFKMQSYRYFMYIYCHHSI